MLVSERENVGVGAQKHREIAVVRADRSLALAGQELLKTLSHAHRAGTWASSTVGCRERFVQVDVHNVKAHVARTRRSQHGIEVCAVVIQQRSAGVDELFYLGNGLLKESKCVGVGHHHGGYGVVEQPFQVVNVNDSLRRALHFHHLKAAHGSRSRVGSVGRVGHNHFRAFSVATALMVTSYHHQAGQLTVSARKRIESELAHACYL